jgi:hypothetical protein
MPSITTLYYHVIYYTTRFGLYGRHQVCHITKYFEEGITEIAVFSEK